MSNTHRPSWHVLCNYEQQLKDAKLGKAAEEKDRQNEVDAYREICLRSDELKIWG